MTRASSSRPTRNHFHPRLCLPPAPSPPVPNPHIFYTHLSPCSAHPPPFPPHPPGSDRDRPSHRDRGGHHGVLVPHKPAGHPPHDPLPAMALPGHCPQLPHLEGQPRRGQERVEPQSPAHRFPCFHPRRTERELPRLLCPIHYFFYTCSQI